MGQLLVKAYWKFSSLTKNFMQRPKYSTLLEHKFLAYAREIDSTFNMGNFVTTILE